MTSAQHRNWINAGRPDSGLALPLARLRDILRAAGYEVDDYPNDAHLDAQPPEDHTYYSETGWPGASPRWWRHAIDIMPPTKPGLPSLTKLGARIVADRNAGRITWLKYINWPSAGSLSAAVHDRWAPNYSRGGSGDTGHIHISSITGVETLESNYNPLLALEVGDMAHSLDDIYNTLVAIANGNQPTAGGNSAIPNWVGRVDTAVAQSRANGAALTALQGSVASLAAKLDALAAKVDALNGAGAGSQPFGDVSVSGTLHLGAKP